ncbi:uncharacterized protein BDZ83DRAFT_305014 [Colletotrichum acutatum]|uniref:Uncharacterized protein n=1 Tax=Glomerella acutata TaxID=27357 RepID=A0AAD8URY3_GLOAC|nr:uncharacterized protein BDZ83DRAFT_305014 [Colletotrichum acutatum]KAK1725320.1 hypothetical protein BDZ83DRAFT_305014 [Colletotrichum acutatum]
MDIESLVGRLARRNAFLIRLVRWYRQLYPTRPHGFTINAFIVDGVTQPVPAPYFPKLLGSWRLMACLIFCNSIAVYSFIFYSVWFSPSLVIISVVMVQIIAFIFRTLGIGSGTFTIGSLLSSVGHYYAASCLVIVSKVSSFWPSIRSYFWFTYCLFAIRRRRFSRDYHEAWRLKHWALHPRLHRTVRLRPSSASRSRRTRSLTMLQGTNSVCLRRSPAHLEASRERHSYQNTGWT